MNNFFEKVKGIADKGVAVSKGVFKTASEKVQDVSAKGVAKVEQMQLGRQVQKQYLELGKYVFAQIKKAEEKSISFNDPNVIKINDEIVRLENEIEKRENS